LKSLAWLKENILKQNLDAVLITKPTNIRYLSGFTGSSGFLLITKTTDLLITDFRYVQQAAGQAKEYKIIRQDADIYKTLKELFDYNQIKRAGLEKEVVTLAVFEEYTKRLPGAEFVPISDPCEQMRAIKSEHEIDTVKKAVEIADRAFLHIRNYLATPGQTENEIALELEFFMHRMGAERKAFDTIVASGERASMPHGTASGKVIEHGDLVTLDFGAVYDGYHSDMTRTLVIGQPDKKQAEIYELVLEAQNAVLERIRPGMRANEADSLARKIIERAGYAENFGHGLGHAVGLDIHEGPRLSPRDETVLQPGMILTIEPGIYLDGWGGVRIEDMIVLTAHGCEVLTKSPKELCDAII